MDDDVVVKLENVSKKFCKSLKRSMFYGVCDISRNSIGLKTKSDQLRKSEFWAVKDVSFELKKGEVLGIIGANGSGKTTLLKMLNGIFWPDKGKISIRGRVGALIAAGVGFHPNLTGRENIYLNGAILGMGRKEVVKKIDEIIDFAAIGDFIDTPVKFYSSGMMVRLGFASAIYIEPEILLIDEILSVGDINFRKKASDKLKEIRTKASTIYISHNLPEIYRLCDRAIYLDNGQIIKSGDVDSVVKNYVRNQSKSDTNNEQVSIWDAIDSIKSIDAVFYNHHDSPSRILVFRKRMRLEVKFHLSEEVTNMIAKVFVLDSDRQRITSGYTVTKNSSLRKGQNCIEILLEEIRLLPGKYQFSVLVQSEGGGTIFRLSCGFVEIITGDLNFNYEWGVYSEDFSWKINSENKN